MSDVRLTTVPARRSAAVVALPIHAEPSRSDRDPSGPEGADE
ncbi:hypothetical protein [Halalkalicoccus paucihalophilus]|nr:hypothetical protein [Halalkalicoccus paucihalophilus]